MKSFKDEVKNVGKGWHPLCERLHERLLALHPNYEILQIKEKMGGLRYYVKGVRNTGRLLIQQAEKLSLTKCEECGKPANPSPTGWRKTLCEEHKGGKK